MSSKYWAKSPSYVRKRKILKRGEPNRRCLHTETGGDYETYYHATKGWRSRYEVPIANTLAGELYASFLGV